MSRSQNQPAPQQKSLKLPLTREERADLIHRAYYIAITDKLEELGYDLENRLRTTSQIQEETHNLIDLFKER